MMFFVVGLSLSRGADALAHCRGIDHHGPWELLDGPFSGVSAVADDSYAVNIIGRTGRFAGTTGQLSNTGVLDTVHSTSVGRYHATICFAQPEH